MNKHESHNTEFKSIWKDEYLKQLCGFANAKGGKLYIGIDDNGKVVGITNGKRLLEEIPNKALNLMGLLLDVSFEQKNDLYYLVITIPESSLPISLRGKYYFRSGTTTQETSMIRSIKKGYDQPVRDPHGLYVYS